MYVIERNFAFKYLKIAPFLVLKDLHKSNTTIELIRLYIDFTYQYSLVKDSIERLRTANCNFTDKLKNMTENLESIILASN